MKDIGLLVIFTVICLWEFIYVPYQVKRNIKAYVEAVNGKIIMIKHLSLRDSLYLFEYEVHGERIRKNIKANFLGDIKKRI